ncbi:TPA: helix-turn-helix domain-containing protein [archaeon]|uniref:Putative HTH-type transcriptional regulatory protein H1011_00530 n=1 Tax=Candidatus Undinarchaeum marinum TaxID=2756141 RepID=A0A832ULD4_9ARCH|nr:helix-turn-helix domain-containing protein [Candidatus Undinarchaeum marinum]
MIPERSQRENLLERAAGLLEALGFSVARQLTPSCFDLLARDGDTIFLLKILSNVDSLTEEQSIDLRRVSNVIGATPMLIGESARGETMMEHTVYERYNIACVSFKTFENALSEHNFPFVYSKKGGFYSHLNTDYLRKLMQKNNISAGALAREAGISKSSLLNYERGQGASIENIERLQEALGDLVLDPIDVFRFEEESPELSSGGSRIERIVESHFGDIGFRTAAVTKASFSLIGRSKKDIIFTGLESKSLEKRAEDIRVSSKVLGQHGMFVLKKTEERQVSGVPVLGEQEFQETVTSKQLLKLLRELEEVD